MRLYSIHFYKQVTEGCTPQAEHCETAPAPAEDIKAFFPNPEPFEQGYLRLYSIERNKYVHWDEVYSIEELIINLKKRDMTDAIQWFKEHFSDDRIQVLTPQFERTEKLEFDFLPENEREFYDLVNLAPYEILYGFGFRKWDTVNNVRAENATLPKTDVVEIPLINRPDETFKIDVGRGNNPTEQLYMDADILLFPGEWYKVIPNGYMVTGLCGEETPFQRGKSDDDTRFGCLPYGITRTIIAPNDKRSDATEE